MDKFCTIDGVFHKQVFFIFCVDFRECYRYTLCVGDGADANERATMYTEAEIDAEIRRIDGEIARLRSEIEETDSMRSAENIGSTRESDLTSYYVNLHRKCDVLRCARGILRDLLRDVKWLSEAK